MSIIKGQRSLSQGEDAEQKFESDARSSKNKETWFRVTSNNYSTYYNTCVAKHEQLFVPKSIMFVWTTRQRSTINMIDFPTLQLWARSNDFFLCHVTASLLHDSGIIYHSDHTFSIFHTSCHTKNFSLRAVHVDSVSANFFFLCGAISTKDAKFKDSQRQGFFADARVYFIFWKWVFWKQFSRL